MPDDYYLSSSDSSGMDYAGGRSGYSSEPHIPYEYPSHKVEYKKFRARLEAVSASPTELLVDQEKNEWLDQGVVFKNIKSYFVRPSNNNIEVHELHFPWVIVLSQACDLRRNNDARIDTNSEKQDKILLSVLVAPIFDLEKAQTGSQLDSISMAMEPLNRKKREFINSDDVARYHQLSKQKFLDCNTITFETGVVDFKHFFTVPIFALRKEDYVTKLNPFFREKLSHRFSSYLSRIGIPE